MPTYFGVYLAQLRVTSQQAAERDRTGRYRQNAPCRFCRWLSPYRQTDDLGGRARGTTGRDGGRGTCTVLPPAIVPRVRTAGDGGDCFVVPSPRSAHSAIIDAGRRRHEMYCRARCTGVIKYSSSPLLAVRKWRERCTHMSVTTAMASGVIGWNHRILPTRDIRFPGVGE